MKTKVKFDKNMIGSLGFIRNFEMKCIYANFLLFITGIATQNTEITCGTLFDANNFASTGSDRSNTAPWAVSIGYYENGEYQHDCTGSILTPTIVITAAHCTLEEENKFILAGARNLRKLNAVQRQIVKTVEHPKFRPPVVYFDVSIAVLDKELEFNVEIGPLCLPMTSSPSADFMNRYAATVQGWGKDDNGKTGIDLTQVDLTIRKKSICNSKYEKLPEARINYFMPNLSISSMFCMDGNLRRNAGTCYGDSGGPTIIKDDNDDEKYVLIGIVSGNPGGCGNTREYPDYFTFIGHNEILPWILETISNIRSCGIFRDCVHQSKCQYYLSETERLKTLVKGSSKFNTISKKLQELTCDERERKICCDSTITWSFCSAPCGPGFQTRSNKTGVPDVKSCAVGTCGAEELIYVSSIGESPDFAGNVMGLYKLSSYHNNAPAYKQLHNVPGTKPWFIYKHDIGYWLAGPELGISRGIYLKNIDSSPSPPRSGWQYFDDDDVWTSDPELRIINVKNTTNFICPVVTITASGEAARKQSDSLGHFRLTGEYSAGRPIYINSNNKYLLVHPGSINWFVGDNVDRIAGWIKAGSAPGLCPASPRSTVNKRLNRNSWQYWDGSEWLDGEISVSCDHENMLC